ncbi:MAG: nucleotide exchange factor GrpE [Clostridiales bacterium]|nr:nucleotide exchange factor GrpE [Clostridiales bacterium]
MADEQLRPDEAAEQTAAEERPADADRQSEEAAEERVPTADEWREALTEAVRQRDEYLAAAQRAQADFANFKRRNATVRADAYDEGSREAIAAMLPALDNLDRAIAAVAEDDPSPLAEGVRMTRRLMFESLGKLGLEEIPALGQAFDPDLHHAVMRCAEGEPGTVLEVFEKGYRVKDRIVRYAMVKVAVEH